MSDKPSKDEIERILNSLKGKSSVFYVEAIRLDYNPATGLSYLYCDLTNSPLPFVLYLDRDLTQARELHRQLGLFLDAVDKGAEWYKPQSNLQ